MFAAYNGKTYIRCLITETENEKKWMQTSHNPMNHSIVNVHGSSMQLYAVSFVFVRLSVLRIFYMCVVSIAGIPHQIQKGLNIATNFVHGNCRVCFFFFLFTLILSNLSLTPNTKYTQLKKTTTDVLFLKIEAKSGPIWCGGKKDRNSLAMLWILTRMRVCFLLN